MNFITYTPLLPFSRVPSSIGLPNSLFILNSGNLQELKISSLNYSNQFLRDSKNIVKKNTKKDLIKTGTSDSFNRLSRKDIFYQSMYFYFFFNKENFKNSINANSFSRISRNEEKITNDKIELSRVKKTQNILKKILNKKISELFEEINIYCKKNEFNYFQNKKYENINKIYSSQFFTSYKKSFLSYWIISFAGLAVSFPNLLQISTPFTFGDTREKKTSITGNMLPNFYLDQKEIINNDINTFNSTTKNLFQLGINTQRNNNLQSIPHPLPPPLWGRGGGRTKLEIELFDLNHKILDGDSLILNYYNLKKFQKNQPNFKKFYFDILIKKKQLRSNLNWYWIDLLVDKDKIKNMEFNVFSKKLESFQPSEFLIKNGPTYKNKFPNKIFLNNFNIYDQSNQNFNDNKTPKTPYFYSPPINLITKIENQAGIDSDNETKTLFKIKFNFLKSVNTHLFSKLLTSNNNKYLNKVHNEYLLLKSNIDLSSNYDQKILLSTFFSANGKKVSQSIENKFNLIKSDLFFNNENSISFSKKSNFKHKMGLNSQAPIENKISTQYVNINPIQSYKKSNFIIDQILAKFLINKNENSILNHDNNNNVSQKNLVKIKLFESGEKREPKIKESKNNFNNLGDVLNNKSILLSSQVELEKTLFSILKSKCIDLSSPSPKEKGKKTIENNQPVSGVIFFKNEKIENAKGFNINKNNYLYSTILNSFKMILRDFIQESIEYYGTKNSLIFLPLTLNNNLASNDINNLRQSSIIEKNVFVTELKRLKKLSKTVFKYNLKFEENILPKSVSINSNNFYFNKLFNSYPVKLNNLILGGNYLVSSNLLNSNKTYHVISGKQEFSKNEIFSKTSDFKSKIDDIFYKNVQPQFSNFNRSLKLSKVNNLIKITSPILQSSPHSLGGSGIENTTKIEEKKIETGNLLKINQQSEFNLIKNEDPTKFLFKYISFLSQSICNLLEAYQYNLVYLPEFKIGSLYKNFIKQNNQKLSKMSGIDNSYNYSTPNFEKIFISSLSKLKRFNSNGIKKKSNFNFRNTKTKSSEKNNIIKNIKSKINLKIKRAGQNNYKSKFFNDKKLTNSVKNSFVNWNASMILKNRLFVHKDIKTNELVKNEINFKKQNYKIKRRLKKMKKETRRRKKRKLFYPRPYWLTFANYNKFLNFKYSSKSKLFQKPLKFISFPFPKGDGDGDRDRENRLISRKVLTIEKKYLEINSFGGYKKLVSSLKLERNKNKIDNKIKTNNSFYQISKTTQKDLKRMLIKSNWLKNNLNPYLNEIKNLYLNCKKNEKSFENYSNIRSLLLNILGETNLNNVRNTKLSSAISLTEYNKLIYSKIQNIIGNIRENLNINGDFKNRTKKLNKNIRNFIRRDYRKISSIRDKNLLQQNQKPNFLVSMLKNILLKVNKLFLLNYELKNLGNYENGLNLSKNNLYWAMNKTNIILNDNIYSSPKKLWEIYKSREIIKSNKTKKLIYTSLTNSKNYLFKTNNLLDNYSNVVKNFNLQDFNMINFKDSHEQNSNESNNLGNLKKNLQPLYTIKSEEKLKNIHNKLNFLGISLKNKQKQQNYKLNYFKFLKRNLSNLYRLSSSDTRFRFPFPFGEGEAEADEDETGTTKKLNKRVESKKLNYKNDYFYIKLKTKQLNSNNFLINQKEQSFKKIIKTNFYWWQQTNFESIFEITKEIKGFLNEISSDGLLTKKSFFKTTQIGTLQTLVSVLFHFVALISFLSLGGIRILIKFYYIVISKISVLTYNTAFFPFLKKNLLSPLNFVNSEINKNQMKIMNIRKSYSKDDLYINKTKNAILSLIKTEISKGSVNNSFLEKEPFFINDKKTNSLTFYKNALLKYFIKKKTKNYLSVEILNTLMLSEKEKSSNSQISWFFIKKKLINLIQTKKDSINIEELLKFSTNENFRKLFKDVNLFLLKKIIPLKENTKIANNKINRDIAPIYFENTSIIRNFDLRQITLRGMISGISKSSILVYSTNKIIFLINLSLLKSVDFFASIIFLIYKFFEKPNEYIVENFAYSFLVEWSGDLITTIPDSVDNNLYLYFTQLNRSFGIYFLNNALLNSSYKLGLFNVSTKPGDSSSIFKLLFYDLPSKSITKFLNLVVISLNYSFLKRFSNLSFLTFINQICEPDSDYLYRKTKGTIFWEIWGENLKKVSDSNAINLYELSTDKEEQIKLLTKYEELNNINNVNNLFGFWNFNVSPLYRFEVFPKVESIFEFNKSLSPYIIDKKSKSLFSFSNLKMRNSNKDGVINNSFSPMINEDSNIYKILKQLKQSTNNNRWAINQYLNYQGKDTDLFIDYHPSNSFFNIPSIKYGYSIHQPLGSIVCQIFSGIFYKQISKNILVIGEQGVEKSIIIQSIAGETELKIITDNSIRYATIYRGIAVGIKLLKDVFEALAVHSPCIFLLEDIHTIGERRPFLIDDASASNDPSYNKNQSMQGFLLKEKNGGTREILYKINKHILSNYKKPYKESRGLATNHYAFTFLYSDLFSKIRETEIELSSGLSINTIKKENKAKQQNKTENSQSLNSSILKKGKERNNKISNSFNAVPFVQGGFKAFLQNSSQNEQTQGNKVKSTFLLINKTNQEILSPPSLSPFNILILKEEKKLNHKKSVKEIPWFGVPGEQLSLISKYNYSVRVKVALLAESLLSNISTKLDMITDLLVIIDSVKGNRGFIVFATTHLPSLLDPALRRPGRFDETISLPLIPKIYSRWTNTRYNFKFLTSKFFKNYWLPSNFNKGITLDLFNSNFNSLNNIIPRLIDSIYLKNEYLLFSNSFLLKGRLHFPSPFPFPKGEGDGKGDGDSQIQGKIGRNIINSSTVTKEKLLLIKTENQLMNCVSSEKEFNKNNSIKSQNFQSKLIKLKSQNYSKACQSLISLILYSKKNDQNLLNYASILNKPDNILENSSLYLTLFTNSFILNKILVYLLSGKLGTTLNDSLITFKNYLLELENNFNNRNFSESFSEKLNKPTEKIILEKKFKKANLKKGVIDLNSDFDYNWKYCSNLLFSFIQKHQSSSFNKNLAFSVNRLLKFNNKYYLMQPGTPPLTNVLLPSKRYENYRKNFKNTYEINDSPTHFTKSISESLNLHSQQRLLKRLYKYPIKEFFRSEILNNAKFNDRSYDNFQASYTKLIPLEKTRLKTLNSISHTQPCYKNILYNRHKTYFTNQWFNGQNGEHNLESTFLSDIDWRYTFVESIGDVNIDFPDSEQYYNPRDRRWIMTKGEWNHWFKFENSLKEIYSYHIYECCNKAYKLIDQNREIIDIYADLFNKKGKKECLNEVDILNIYTRFTRISQ